MRNLIFEKHELMLFDISDLAGRTVNIYSFSRLNTTLIVARDISTNDVFILKEIIKKEKVKEKKKLITRFLCFIGCHTWQWILKDTGGTVCLDAPPPCGAKCKYCGVTYKNK